MIPAVTYNNNVFNVNTSALSELYMNNCTMPNIDNVIYNLDMNGRKLSDGTYDPVLTTVVFFVDNTKVIVKNSANDKVVITKHILSDGSTVDVADRESKERGLIYAILKRLVSDIDDNGNTAGGSLGNILQKIVESAQDNIINNAEVKITRAANKKRHAEQVLNAKPKQKRYSIVETLNRINEVIDQIINTCQDDVSDSDDSDSDDSKD